jgi:hypothetical protein
MIRWLPILLLASCSVSLFAKETKEAAFWHWFQQNENRLFAFEKDRDRIFDDLASALGKVHTDLTFEFGPVGEDGRREFVISAAGLKPAFPSVEALWSSAPKTDKWIIVKFRPRRMPINDVKLAGTTIRSKDVRYVLFEDRSPEKVGLMLFLPGYREDKRTLFGQMGYLFLDEALGEYDVEMRVGAIVFQGQGSEYFEKARPLNELPKDFDGYFANPRQ